MARLAKFYAWILWQLGLHNETRYAPTPDEVARKEAEEREFREHVRRTVLGPCLLCEMYAGRL